MGRRVVTAKFVIGVRMQKKFRWSWNIPWLANKYLFKNIFRAWITWKLGDFNWHNERVDGLFEFNGGWKIPGGKGTPYDSLKGRLRQRRIPLIFRLLGPVFRRSISVNPRSGFFSIARSLIGWKSVRGEFKGFLIKTKKELLTELC